MVNVRSRQRSDWNRLNQSFRLHSLSFSASSLEVVGRADVFSSPPQRASSRGAGEGLESAPLPAPSRAAPYSPSPTHKKELWRTSRWMEGRGGRGEPDGNGPFVTRGWELRVLELVGVGWRRELGGVGAEWR